MVLRKAADSYLEIRLVCKFTRSVVGFCFVTSRTPPLWQRGLAQVHCDSSGTAPLSLISPPALIAIEQKKSPTNQLIGRASG